MKPVLSMRQILNMNLGFFGIQFSFGLQQANMSPIYKFLGSPDGDLAVLQLAGPITGLLVQPIVGAMSDRTASKSGRRTPYFLIGAVLCSLGLLIMPFSPTLWFAAGMLWILDAANNVTMEPYRAYVTDRLNKEQHEVGFLVQSAFTGLAQTLAYLTPSIMLYLGMNKDAVTSNNIPYTTLVAFLIGAVISSATVFWSIKKVPELPLSAEELSRIKAAPKTIGAIFEEIWEAIVVMPTTMRRLWWMCLFQWSGMLCYWIYITSALARTMFNTTDGKSAGFRDASLLTGEIGGFYNFIAFLSAFAMIPISRKLGAKPVHAVCLALAGLGMLAIPGIQSKAMLFVPMIGIGLAWASIMGNPYVMLAGCIPAHRAGVYMGIFNMFIVIPMLILQAAMFFFFDSVLGGRADNAIRLGGALLLIAAVATLFVKVESASSTQGQRAA
jgi:maltose/moltooligosaccharide transporter